MPDVTLTIDGKSVTVPAGTLLVEAAKTIKTDVPVYCYHPKLGPAGLCRICLVNVEKTPKLQIACNTTVAEGMVVHTYGPKVEEGRRAVLEFLLVNHPLDCPICDKGGECDLQDFAMAYGQGASRLADPKNAKPKAIDLGPTIVLDDERCIVCQRCSRFDEIITLERSLVVKDRGQRDVIATATGEPYRSNFSGNVTELCPVGALTSKTYRFKSRPWDLARTTTTCTQCSVGCALNVDVRHGEILRTMSVEDDPVSDGWLCDRGRYNVGFYSSERRLTMPLLRDGDSWAQIAWSDAIELWAAKLKEAKSGIASLGGARLLNEEIVLLDTVLRALATSDVDWRTGRQRQASPGPRAATLNDLDAAQVIVLVGRPPAQTAPVLDLRVRKAVSQNGARLVVVGDHDPGAPIAHERVAVAGLGTIDMVKIERVVAIWDGIDASAGAQTEAWLAGLEGRGVSATALVPGESPNARGAEALGLLPRSGGRDARAILQAARAGELRVLSIFGANPVVHTPGGPEEVRRALRNVPFVVATDLFLTETAGEATLVLPARAAFEKRGHSYDLTGTARPVRTALGAPDGSLADEEILVALAAELGIEIPTGEELRAKAVQPAPNIAKGLGDAAICGATEPRASSDGAASGPFRLAIAADSFAGAGTLLHDERLCELWAQPVVALNARTAAVANVRDGDQVELGAGGRALSGLRVKVDPRLTDGTLTIVDGIAAAPASAFAEGEAVTLSAVRDAVGAGR